MDGRALHQYSKAELVVSLNMCNIAYDRIFEKLHTTESQLAQAQQELAALRADVLRIADSTVAVSGVVPNRAMIAEQLRKVAGGIDG